MAALYHSLAVAMRFPHNPGGLLMVMLGTTLLSTMTTRGIEFSQSLWRSTFHGSSGLALRFVRLRSALLGFVAGIPRALWHSPETGASS